MITNQDNGYLWEVERSCNWDAAHGKGFWGGWQSSVFPDHRGGYFIIAMCVLCNVS